jgi:excisionase family DNA binding protein
MTMMTKRKIEIVAFERERIVRRAVPIYCTVCQLNTELLTTRQAGALAQVKSPSIYRWLTQGKAHGVKTSGGQYRICKNSLFHLVHFSLPQSENRFAHEGDQP